MKFFKLLFFAVFMMALATGAQASVQNPLQASIGHKMETFTASGKSHGQKKVKKFKALRVLKAVKKATDDRTLVAALLAFFLGGLGIHRVYLGADGIIILWYIISIFGIFGLIPLIDFIRILINGTEHYEGNSSLFRAFQ
jgi:TM2 domain-containing membrane protein YozV